ncbi:MAG: bifunctional UDP-N-acetylmuramoyl-tripeptide:D-alanyl-D-alanine ligase/alanine racemase [Muribaculum sp.]|nr:bifunctional UDP-N-acetylmuramoyl-tripeptide:D-alanyl-D-alanine ligase/alanine racemase [Muribaculum sp.]
MKSNTSEIAALLACEVVGCFDCRPVEYLLTDSRSLGVAASSLFFAISTPNANGADYIRDLYDKGVRAFVVNKLPDSAQSMPLATFFVVADTVDALQKIASHHPGFHGHMVGITGSRGKTTLKEWIFQLMEPLDEIVRSPRSYNSQIGVPLSLWEIEDTTEIALIEAGVSKSGEMERLAECICPDTVIITNIGADHAEGFSSIKQKAREKTLLAAFPTVRSVIYNADADLQASTISQMCGGKRLLGWSYTDPQSPLYLRRHPQGDRTEIEFTYTNTDGSILKGSVTAPLDSEPDFENAANAIAFMLLCGVAPDVISQRFDGLHKINTRLNVSEGVNGCSVIFDSYTSDFSSLRPALDFMRRRAMPGQKPVVVMSDLRHEGGDPDELYRRIARLTATDQVARLIGIGKGFMDHAYLFGEGSRFFESTGDFMQALSPSDFSDEIILLKGAPEFDFGKILEMLEARTHETVLEVNLDAVVRNYNYFRSHVPAGTGMIAMVKASGYGAGSYEIAKTLQDAGAAYLAVAVLDEGIDLRRQGITMPIMVMNPKVVNYKAMFAYGLEPEIYSMSMLADVIREAGKNGVEQYPVHIKLDTGMHRMGFIESELPAMMDMLCAQTRVVARTVFSHLATADCPDMNDYTELQLNRFKQYSDYMNSRSTLPILRHVLNSAGILRYADRHHYDFVRLGIGLYGVNTLPPDLEKPLSPVSSLRTVIINIREYDEGESIGYGRRGLLHRHSRVATIPIGYADGMNRHFGNGAISVRVNGHDAPTVGNICMDACMIDVTGIDCREGDAVEIFGPEAGVQRLADVLRTIPYEILTSVSPRVKRVYYRE